jgi:hypothetical protein
MRSGEHAAANTHESVMATEYIRWARAVEVICRFLAEKEYQ